MQVNFFASDDDVATVWQWLFEVPGMEVLESYSRPNEPNRFFENWDAVVSSLAERAPNLAAWPKFVGGKPQTQTVRLHRTKPWQLRGGIRTILNSPALINVHRNNDQNGCMAAAYLSCWNEKGARQRSIFTDELLDSVDWKKFRSILGEIKRKQLSQSPARLGSVPIMADAFSRLRNGEIKLWNFGGGEVAYPHPDITLV